MQKTQDLIDINFLNVSRNLIQKMRNLNTEL